MKIDSRIIRAFVIIGVLLAMAKQGMRRQEREERRREQQEAAWERIMFPDYEARDAEIRRQNDRVYEEFKKRQAVVQ
jgi:hypothetical protein